MTDHDDHDTDVAPTEMLYPPEMGMPLAEDAEPAEEPSPDDFAVAESSPPNWYIRIGSLFFLAVIVVLIMIPIFEPSPSSDDSKQVVPKAKPSATVPVNALPSVPTVAPSTAPAMTPTPGFSAYDQKFLSLMTQEGWGCIDDSGAEQCTNQMVSFAHQICSYSGQSVDLIYQELGLPAFLGPGEERMAIVNAEQAYPNCTLTESP